MEESVDDPIPPVHILGWAVRPLLVMRKTVRLKAKKPPKTLSTLGRLVGYEHRLLGGMNVYQ